MKTKRILVLLLSLLMLFPLGLTAFAAGTETGSITINNALNGNTFTLYKIFDLESYIPEENKYVYTIRNDSPLYATVKNMMIKTGTPAKDKPVFALTSKNNDVDYVQLTIYFAGIQDDGVEIKAIASQLMEVIKTLTPDQKAALSMRQIKNLGITGQTDIDKNEAKLPAANAGDITATQAAGEGNENKSNIKFSNLTLGYYLVDSTAGTMIGLTTTNPDVTITAKNKLPSVVKEVKRTADNTWQESNTKIIGETVNYRVQVGVQPGATNYVIYDSLSEGLTFDKITKVYYGYENNPDAAHVIYDAATDNITDPTVTEYFAYTEATEAASITHDGKNCCFKMKFEDKFLNQVLNGVQNGGSGYQPTIFVEYDAKLNEKAVIGEVGNPNDIYLTYGENDVDVSHDTVKTYTYEMELVKTKDDSTVITGAEFEVYMQRTLAQTAATALDATEELSGKLTFVKIIDDPSGKTVYRVATKDEIDDTTIETTTIIEVGDVIIRGLGGKFNTQTSQSGRMYYFKEIKAPEGYTLIPTSTPFEIKDTNQTAKVEVGKWISGGLQIVNKSGSLLPQTGGIGTTIFYIVGGMMLVGAAVLLITKRRMSALKESK